MRAITMWVLLAGCGGAAAAPPPAPVANTGGSSDEVRVYAWSGAGLDALYCARGGALHADECAWPDALALPDGTRAGRTIDRERPDGEIERVRTYGARRPAAMEVTLVIERAGAVAVWAAPFHDEAGPNAQPLPARAPERVANALDVRTLAVHATTGPHPVMRGTLTIDAPAGARSLEVISYGGAVAYAGLDLDDDGAPEVVYLGADDGGAYAAVAELTGSDDGFAARRQ